MDCCSYITQSCGESCKYCDVLKKRDIECEGKYSKCEADKISLLHMIGALDLNERVKQSNYSSYSHDIYVNYREYNDRLHKVECELRKLGAKI